MQTYTLKRSGLPALTFTGKQIASVSSKGTTKTTEQRYHDIAIYLTRGGKYIVAVNYFSNWRNEPPYYEVEAFISPQGVSKWLSEYDPTHAVIGYPPHPTFEARQERLLDDIERRFDQIVSEAMTQAQFVEEVQ